MDLKIKPGDLVRLKDFVEQRSLLWQLPEFKDPNGNYGSRDTMYHGLLVVTDQTNPQSDYANVYFQTLMKYVCVPCFWCEKL